MPREDLIQLRAGTAAAWTAANPVLALDSNGVEIGIETDTGLMKIGDNATAWNSLPYAAAGPTATQTLTNKTLAAVILTGLAHYASNAAAITGGLTTGQLYRNGDNLCIVH